MLIQVLDRSGTAESPFPVPFEELRLQEFISAFTKPYPNPHLGHSSNHPRTWTKNMSDRPLASPIGFCPFGSCSPTDYQLQDSQSHLYLNSARLEADVPGFNFVPLLPGRAVLTCLNISRNDLMFLDAAKPKKAIKISGLL